MSYISHGGPSTAESQERFAEQERFDSMLEETTKQFRRNPVRIYEAIIHSDKLDEIRSAIATLYAAKSLTETYNKAVCFQALLDQLIDDYARKDTELAMDDAPLQEIRDFTPA